ncbi:MAG: 16S rRNA (uracil(1498)-N(3))-methyltransferase [Campylobacterota bacterium]
MQYIYLKNASDLQITVSDENFKYLSKVRRFGVGQVLYARNLLDGYLYTYSIDSIDKRSLSLSLQDKKIHQKSLQPLHIGWCVVDFKIIEKTLPFLNEIGVTAITFIYCAKSQKNFKPNFTRMEKILINSCQQCGRDSLMQLETCENIDAFIAKHPDAHLCDFGGEAIKDRKIETLIVGPEGGFSEDESSTALPKVGFNGQLILRSETAVTALASKILL